MPQLNIPKRGYWNNMAANSTIPYIGMEIACDISLIRQDETANGVATTPMTKVRFDFETHEWKQVRPSEAGMYVFFTNEPEVIHKSFRITSIIPSRTGCYAELL